MSLVLLVADILAHARIQPYCVHAVPILPQNGCPLHMMNTKEQYETLASVIEDRIIRHGELFRGG